MINKHKQVKKLVSRFILLLLPFALWFIVELFILPIDFFTFRVWETLLVKEMKLLPGPFYPDKLIYKTEEGELAPHTQWAIKKEVVWFTDHFGYRNRNSHLTPDIVIIGDSNITGVNLTQDSILSEVLENLLDTCVYSFAPAHINRYLTAEKFKENPPKVVVFSSIERMIISLPPVDKNNFKSNLRAAIGPMIISSDLFTTLAVTIDRIIKWPFYYFIRSQIFSDTKDLPYHNGDQFFLQGEYAVRDISQKRFDRSIKIIESYKKAIEARGARFIFLPIPDKENIYYELLPSQKKPEFLPKLVEALEQKNIEVVNIQPAFENAYERGELVFFKDDAHWNNTGVKIAADMLADQIKKKQNSSKGITSKALRNN